MFEINQKVKIETNTKTARVESSPSNHKIFILTMPASKKKVAGRKHSRGPSTSENNVNANTNPRKKANKISTKTKSTVTLSKGAATKRGKKEGSIGDLGLTVRLDQAVYIKCDILQSMLRVRNITSKNNSNDNAVDVEIPACASLQRALGRSEITGDDGASHLPVGLGQGHQLRFDVIRANRDLLTGGRAMDSDQLQNMMQNPQGWTMEELMEMIRPLPGSEQKRNHYLGYRRSIWKAVQQNTTQKQNKAVDADIILHIMTGQPLLKRPYKCKPSEKIFLVPDALLGASVAFVVPQGHAACASHAANSPDANSPDATTTSGSSIESSLEEFVKSIGTTGCVSLLQKIIRRRPAELQHPDTDESFEASSVIRACVHRLLDPQQPGIFLPDQGVYVSARQHFCKRLLIIMAEDSAFDDSNACLLACSALLLECEPSWEPPPSLQQEWSKLAVELWKSPRTSEFKREEGMRINILSSMLPLNPMHLSALVLEELGGMKGDKGMLKWLCTNQGDSNRNTLQATSTVSNGIDSLDIYCDHHVNAAVVYLWRPRLARGPARTPFGPELSAAFSLVSGRNPRRYQKQSKMTQKEKKHETAIQLAMKEASRIIRGIQKPFPSINDTNSTVEYLWSVPDGALAGMVGPIEMNVGGKKLVVTIDPADLCRWVIIPKPSRNSNLKDITNDERKQGLQRAAEIFAEGVPLKAAPHPSLNGLTATFLSDEGKWQVDSVDWAARKQVSFELVQYPQWATDYEELPFESLEEYSAETIQWVAGKIGGYDPTVHMPTIARDGSGTKESLTGLESYSLLRKLSLKYPDALWPARKFSFKTKCIPLRLEIRERLLSSIKNQSSAPYPKWSDDRNLKPLQEEALVGLLKADATGMGSFLWMLVGSGKSLTVLSFIHKTRRSNSTLWCLPMSAMKSVAAEVRRTGWSVRILASSSGRLKHHDWASPQEKTLDSNLESGVITLVEHDDVRNLVTQLSPQMLSTTFVYDEVHKAMAAKTQRTGSALRLAQLAKQMVALTGTPIVDSRAFMLIKWLQFCVPFQVHSRNFWVAANSMIAKLTSTPVQIDRRNVTIPLSHDQRQSIDTSLPPRLGGTARKPNFQQAYKLSMKAVDDWIVGETIRVVHGKRTKAPAGCPPGECHADAVAATRLLPPTEALFDHLSQRVLLVAADNSHAGTLVKMLLSEGAAADEIQVIGGRRRPANLPSKVKHASSVCFTAEEWRDGDWVPNICVAPISFCEGYSLTWMTTMISGVYPSNQAKRTQMEGRINRANCERMHRTYVTAMAGLTEVMYKYQRNAKNLESALANLSKIEG